MLEEINIDSLIHALAKRVAAQVRAELAAETACSLHPRLLTVEQAAVYMGRSEEAMQHMVASGKVPTVRMDRRVFVDLRDLERLIEDSKNGAPGR
jgi:excisionase family DNA binding protein